SRAAGAWRQPRSLSQEAGGADFGFSGSACRCVIFHSSPSVRKIIVARRTCGTGSGSVTWWTVQRSIATVYAVSTPTYLSRYSNSTGFPVPRNCADAHSYRGPISDQPTSCPPNPPKIEVCSLCDTNGN